MIQRLNGCPVMLDFRSNKMDIRFSSGTSEIHKIGALVLRFAVFPEDTAPYQAMSQQRDRRHDDHAGPLPTPRAVS